MESVSRVDTGGGGQGSDTSKRGICHFFSKAGGCYRKNCPFQHVADQAKGKSKGDDGKGKGKGKGKDKEGKGKVQQVESSQTSGPSSPNSPEAKAKAKADSKGKSKAEAKAEAQKLLGVDDAKPKVSMIRVGPIVGRFRQGQRFLALASRPNRAVLQFGHFDPFQP